MPIRGRRWKGDGRCMIAGEIRDREKDQEQKMLSRSSASWHDQKINDPRSNLSFLAFSSFSLLTPLTGPEPIITSSDDIAP